MQRSCKRYFRRNFLLQWQLYALCLPALVFLAIFNYAPMYGVQIAFRDYTFAKGITGSDWVGLEYFVRFITAHNFETLVWNTLSLNLYGLLVFPAPILLALMLNILPHPRFKKLVQTATYAPAFYLRDCAVRHGAPVSFPRQWLVNVAIVAWAASASILWPSRACFATFTCGRMCGKTRAGARSSIWRRYPASAGIV